MKKKFDVNYGPKLGEIIEDTNNIGEEMNDSYLLVKKYIDDNTIDIDLVQIQDKFQNGTDKYKRNLVSLKNLKAPIKELGKHNQMISAYEDYVDGCQLMVDSLNDDSVDEEKFNESEKNQEESSDRVTKVVQRILTSYM
ncbi:hypothetical protein GSH19_05615 [Lactobacillus sp. S2-2]|uniref:hypothetical protein n=1 Tax=Lactobacillus sp. S2-2 TaxID=2692917 RepID=UPI001F3104E6|nr:hypothetical protein [Lactobacillus sp. S2-2]MCF6515626.1 hypothetical protein [Lactobacillus sp. S2-2]